MLSTSNNLTPYSDQPLSVQSTDIFWQPYGESASIYTAPPMEYGESTSFGKDSIAMMDSLTIRNFRGFSSLEIPKLARFTLLGGGNNAGKTSVLEAVYLYLARLNPLSFVTLQQFRGLTEIPLDLNAMWAPFFFRHNLSIPISIDTKFGIRSEKLTLSYQSHYLPKIRPQPGSQGVPVVKTNQTTSPAHVLKTEVMAGDHLTQRSFLIMDSSGLRSEVEEAETMNIPGVFIPSRGTANIREEAIRFGAMDVKNKSAEIVEFVKIVEPRLVGLSAIAIGNGTVIHGDIGVGVKMPIYSMGDGVVRVLGTLLAIASTGGGIVMIDELGNGIHYSILSRYCEAISAAAERYNVQVIATTHSNELLREAHKGLVNKKAEDFAYIRIDRSSEGAVAKTYDYEMLGIAMEQGLEIR
jgi:AAA domain, putative AbiEii toxin, Type IV TA system